MLYLHGNEKSAAEHAEFEYAVSSGFLIGKAERPLGFDAGIGADATEAAICRSMSQLGALQLKCNLERLVLQDHYDA